MNLSEIEKTINEDHKSQGRPVCALLVNTNLHLKQKTKNKLQTGSNG